MGVGQSNAGMEGQPLSRLEEGKGVHKDSKDFGGQGLANRADVGLSYQCGTEVMSEGVWECALVGYRLHLRHSEFDMDWKLLEK